MFIKINSNQLNVVKSFIVLVIVYVVVPCNAAILVENVTDPVISRTSGLNVLYNMFGMPTYKQHSFTSILDSNEFSKGLFQLVKSAVRRCVNIYMIFRFFL